MAILTRTALKALFTAGLRPIQQNYHDWLDSFFHKSEEIPMSSVTGLSGALSGLATSSQIANLQSQINSISSGAGKTVINATSGNNNFSVLADMLITDIIIQSTTTQNVFFETSVNAADLTSLELTANVPFVQSPQLFFVSNATINIRCTNNCKIIILYK